MAAGGSTRWRALDDRPAGPPYKPAGQREILRSRKGSGPPVGVDIVHPYPPLPSADRWPRCGWPAGLGQGTVAAGGADPMIIFFGRDDHPPDRDHSRFHANRISAR